MPALMTFTSVRFVVQTSPIKIGGSGNDTILGTQSTDYLYGNDGADFLYGGGGRDYLFGGQGNDTLYGGTGDDYLQGDDGNDMLNGGAGADYMFGSAGTDTVSYTNATIGVMLDLATGGITNDAAGDRYIGIENVMGSNHGDIINGDNGANVIHGYGGDDFLFGGQGHDVVFGGAGNDTIRGGHGDDWLAGGAGQDRLTGGEEVWIGYDTFAFAPNEGADIVTDFQRGYDTLDVTAFGIRGFGYDGRLAVGDTSRDHRWSGGLDINDRLAFDPTDSTLYLIEVYRSNHAMVVASRTAIVTLEGVTTLSADDLAIINSYSVAGEMTLG